MGNDCCSDPDENLKWSAVLGQSVDEDLQSFATLFRWVDDDDVIEIAIALPLICHWPIGITNTIILYFSYSSLRGPPGTA